MERLKSDSEDPRLISSLKSIAVAHQWLNDHYQRLLFEKAKSHANEQNIEKGSFILSTDDIETGYCVASSIVAAFGPEVMEHFDPDELTDGYSALQAITVISAVRGLDLDRSKDLAELDNLVEREGYYSSFLFSIPNEKNEVGHVSVVLPGKTLKDELVMMDLSRRGKISWSLEEITNFPELSSDNLVFLLNLSESTDPDAIELSKSADIENTKLIFDEVYSEDER